MPAKAKKVQPKAQPKKSEAKVEEAKVEKVEIKATGKFEVHSVDGKFFVYNPEGVRISAGEENEAKAHDLAQRMQGFRR